jgi:hypothetical protein
MPWRIAEELAARGYRNATSPHQLGDADIKDPPLLRLIHDKCEPAVLVTFDNRLPIQHAQLVAKCRTTLAIIDKNAQPPELTREEYWREVIHRHVHRMVHQDAGSCFIYTRRQRRPCP